MRYNSYAHKTEHLTKEILEIDYAELKSGDKITATTNILTCQNLH